MIPALVRPDPFQRADASVGGSESRDITGGLPIARGLVATRTNRGCDHDASSSRRGDYERRRCGNIRPLSLPDSTAGSIRSAPSRIRTTTTAALPATPRPMTKQSAQDKLALQIRQLVLNAARSVGEPAEEAVQTVAWLVGLSTGFLGLVAFKPDVLKLVGSHGVVLILSLVGVVVLGVAQRLIHQVATLNEKRLAQSLQFEFWSMSEQPNDPEPLEDGWPREELARRLSDHLDADLNSLIEQNAPIEKYRELYRTLLGQWKDREASKANRLQDLLAAIAGKPAPISEPPDAQTRTVAISWIDSIRRQARSAKRWTRMAALLYWAVSGMFVVAAGIIAIALLTLSACAPTAALNWWFVPWDHLPMVPGLRVRPFSRHARMPSHLRARAHR